MEAEFSPEHEVIKSSPQIDNIETPVETGTSTEASGAKIDTAVDYTKHNEGLEKAWLAYEEQVENRLKDKYGIHAELYEEYFDEFKAMMEGLRETNLDAYNYRKVQRALAAKEQAKRMAEMYPDSIALREQAKRMAEMYPDSIDDPDGPYKIRNSVDEFVDDIHKANVAEMPQIRIDMAIALDKGQITQEQFQALVTGWERHHTEQTQG